VQEAVVLRLLALWTSSALVGRRAGLRGGPIRGGRAKNPCSAHQSPHFGVARRRREPVSDKGFPPKSKRAVVRETVPRKIAVAAAAATLGDGVSR
jgi:hypothetical protein